MIRSGKRVRNGFTLVEMLVVIVIIGILAALITAAAATALWSAKQTKIKVEVDQLAAAMEAFKQKYGSYPPANLNCPVLNGLNTANAQLTAFVARAFPRYVPLGTNSLGAQIGFDLKNAGVDVNEFNPQEALVFWLGGFGPDPTDPFNRNNVAVTRSPFFSFDQSRLVLAETNATSQAIAGSPAPISITGTVYLTDGVTLAASGVGGSTPTYAIGQIVYNAPYGNAAYCYFDHQSYGYTTAQGLAPLNTSTTPYSVYVAPLNTSNPPLIYGVVYGTSSFPTPEVLNGVQLNCWISTGTGYVMPYIFDVNGNGSFDMSDTFCKPTSFQIISAGQDGSFGMTNAPTNGRLYPAGLNYDMPPTLGGSADDDNVTNFCEKSTLDAAKP